MHVLYELFKQRSDVLLLHERPMDAAKTTPIYSTLMHVSCRRFAVLMSRVSDITLFFCQFIKITHQKITCPIYLFVKIAIFFVFHFAIR